MDVRFWGVRGSIPVSGETFVRTGGNTSCLELCHAGERLILDGGTGLRALGDSLGSPCRAAILFSHVHWDHIQGVPFFGPAFHPDSQLTFMGTPRASGSLRDALTAQMRPPTFPITLEALRAQVQFVDLPSQQARDYGPFRITALDLPHPDGVSGFRIEAGGRSLVYATDVEHGEGLRPELIRLAEGADLLVHDAQFSREEYLGKVGFSRVGWGHSPWEDAVEVARLADVAQLRLFHHDPRRNDAGVDDIEAQARLRFPRLRAAREGEVVRL
jgi:phosphoribosyl 1,2-cyclic phosphodiesterase